MQANQFFSKQGMRQIERGNETPRSLYRKLYRTYRLAKRCNSYNGMSLLNYFSSMAEGHFQTARKRTIAHRFSDYLQCPTCEGAGEVPNGKVYRSSDRLDPIEYGTKPCSHCGGVGDYSSFIKHKEQ